jgi:hydroxymethylglutaryl-CoA synthase
MYIYICIHILTYLHAHIYIQTCYLQALDDCYTRFIAKQNSIRGVDSNITTEDFLLFHSPYNKLVQKSVSRLAFLDIVSGVSTYVYM